MIAIGPKQRVVLGKWTLHARDLLIGLSLANLCYIRAWLPLLDPEYAAPVLHRSPDRVWLLAAICNVVVLAFIFAGIVQVIRNHPRARWQNAGRAIFVLGLLFPVGEFFWIVRKKYDFLYTTIAHFGRTPALLIYGVLAVVFVVAVWRWHVALARVTAVVIVALSPAVAVTFGQAILRLTVHRPDPLANKPPAALNANAPRTPRVLWFVFDEWDYRLTFVQRKEDLQLPEIDRFARTAFTTANAIPPGSETMLSMPMLLTGERYASASLAGIDRYQVEPFDQRGRHESLADQPLIFGEARKLGFNAALVGWYLPYCRLFGDQVNQCSSQPMGRPENAIRSDSIPHAMLDQTRSIFETTTFSPLGSSLAAWQHIPIYRALLNDSIQAVSDPRYGLVFSHLPVPHYPFVYDRHTGTWATSVTFTADRYYDALALLDRTVGEIRRTLEAAGQWDNSIIIFTSDHYYRWARNLTGRYHSRVPFLVKMPNQDHAVSYDRRFNTITTKSLVLALLRGELRTPEDIVLWLDRHAIVCDTVNAISD